MALIDRLEPLLIRTGDPTVIALIDALAEAIQSDRTLRATLIDLIAFVLEVDRVPLLLHGFDALLQAGSLGELLALVDAVILSADCADDSQTLTARMLHAFTRP